jgi:3-methyladenine DNA glycosylase AlkD
MTYDDILADFEVHRNPDALAGMARYGIATAHAYGISIPHLRALAKGIRTDHALAEQLWASGIHEARILAGLVADPRATTEALLETWAGDFDSWDLCDQCCANLFERTPFAYTKAVAWSAREAAFVKRAGFVLMARLAVSDKRADDARFLVFLPLIQREATDDRNVVKKAVNWALRQIGKRSQALNAEAIETAHALRALDSRAARWIAADALRELQSDAVQTRLQARATRPNGARSSNAMTPGR